MNHYPAIKARMGSWDYYICKMTLKELANEVRFASEIYDDRTLDEAIQRELNEGRVKKRDCVFFDSSPGPLLFISSRRFLRWQSKILPSERLR